MADLSLITEFSGITITSDQNTGTSNPNATFAVPNVTTAQRALLENVTPYVVNGVTVKIKNGTIIYNITTQSEEIFINGFWSKVPLIRTGTIALENIGAGVIGPVAVTGDLVSASRTVVVAGPPSTSTFRVVYQNLGYTPLCFISKINTGVSTLSYVPTIINVANNTTFDFIVQQTTAVIDVTTVNILLIRP